MGMSMSVRLAQEVVALKAEKKAMILELREIAEKAAREGYLMSPFGVLGIVTKYESKEE